VGPRAGLDTEARGKNLLPLPEIETQSPGILLIYIYIYTNSEQHESSKSLSRHCKIFSGKAQSFHHSIDLKVLM
jgi:hypothetical protein